MNEFSAYLHLAELRLCPGFEVRTLSKILKLFAILIPSFGNSTPAQFEAICHMQSIET
jgi:hypothetical protein